MAWTYFTAPLEVGDEISKNQRNELIDVFLERAAAVEPLTGKSFSVSTEMREGGFRHELVRRDSGSGDEAVTLLTGIGDLLSYYGRPAIVEAASFDAADLTTWTWTTILAAAGVGETIDELTEEPSMERLGRWNAIRAVLNQLIYPRVKVASGVKLSRSISVNFAEEDEEAAWSEAKSDFTAATETESAIGISTPLTYSADFYEGVGAEPFVFEISGTRMRLTLEVPAVPAFEAATGLLVAIQNDGNLPFTAEYQGDPTNVPTTGVTYPTLKYVEFGGGGATGEQDLDVYFDVHFGTGLDDYRPALDVPIAHEGTMTSNVFAVVVWEKGG